MAVDRDRRRGRALWRAEMRERRRGQTADLPLRAVVDESATHFRFSVIEESGQIVGGFSDVSGLNAEVTIAAYRAGTDKQNHVTKVPGVHAFENVTLERGIVDAKTFWDWMNELWTQRPSRLFQRPASGPGQRALGAGRM